MEAKWKLSFLYVFFVFGCVEGFLVLRVFFVEQVSELARILDRNHMENILREIN